MADFWGNQIRLALFGESHGPAIGVTIDGIPAGLELDMEEIGFEMARRAPGKSRVATARREPDLPEIVSGVKDGVTTGTALTAVIRNTNQHSSDYGDAPDVLRPGHADYTGHVRYFGFEDHRGGGHFSGRLTAPIVFAGAICKQYLRRFGIRFAAHVESIRDVKDERFDPMLKWSPELDALRGQTIPTLNPDAGTRMEQAVVSARAAQESVGGVIECAVLGLPAGLGAPFFDSVESVFSHLMFSVPAVKGIEFGLGFENASLLGSQCNDEMEYADGRIAILSNRSGGVNGGITNGNPVIFRAAIRPTASIAKPQHTVSLQSGENVLTGTGGRHDPCIVPRAVPVIEAMAAIGTAELWKERLTCRI
ncbi:MAG: chorismate synthase [Clostridia bacterium]|nr:chorismate synthase [Clostridia bacterium]